MRVSRQRVIEAVRSETPGLTQAWAIEAEDRRFPITQAWACAIGLLSKEFRAERAARIFKQLGVQPFEVRQPRPSVLPPRGMVGNAAAAREEQP